MVKCKNKLSLIVWILLLLSFVVSIVNPSLVNSGTLKQKLAIAEAIVSFIAALVATYMQFTKDKSGNQRTLNNVMIVLMILNIICTTFQNDFSFLTNISIIVAIITVAVIVANLINFRSR
ncbi:hypothetical protein MOO45_01765 [Bombilactobacillus folatiphilus]|uniref:Uncharacterized protein n=1 Tax=Bombilactobacillus folatiphilus TaxID=2923362 RepID=A0ABY4PAR8_9LACO|nr:hypothetical protein [Bombilactobacillus folatiphilus]UQS82437.1 hypothetical protein MOO45_01765 [Bombilactobacillus folatiphilus]